MNKSFNYLVSNIDTVGHGLLIQSPSHIVWQPIFILKQGWGTYKPHASEFSLPKLEHNFVSNKISRYIHT